MNKRLKYERPWSRNLSDTVVKGGPPGPLGVCTAGQFPWNGCQEGSNFGPQTCFPGTSALIGNNCNAGPNPDTGTTQCYPDGSVASNTCGQGRFA